MQRDDRARTVGFWRAVEMLSPSTVPKTDRGGPEADQRVFDLGPDDRTPWDSGHPLTADPLPSHLAWQFTVYGGLYELSSIRTALVRAFGDDGKPPEAGKNGLAAVFALTVDADGFVVENSGTLSTCAWALGRLGDHGPGSADWLDGFEDEAQAFASGLDQLAPPTPERDRPTAFRKAARAVGEQAKAAAIDAAGAGAKATGAAVTTAAATAIGSLAGPVAGGIAGAVAGTFAEKLLTPRPKGATAAAPGAAGPRTPRFLITAGALHEFTAELAAALGVTDVLDPRGIRIQCTKIRVKTAAEAAEQTFLNSFIADDLATVERAVRRGDLGTGLASYLDGAPAGRIDVRDQPRAVVDGVDPAALPRGRWPGAVTRPLVLSQQFAVDRIMADVGTGAGVFAVNGPPGTGKTTLLRDVIAAVLVGRARTLAGLPTPADAFTGQSTRVKITETYSVSVRGLDPAVTGAEILVATAGNTAAANVTAEIPGIGAVAGAEAEATAAGYFTDLASHVLGGPAWGLLAATLGNRNNCGVFAKRFWWGDEAGGARSAADGGTPAPAVLGMQQLLRRAREEPDTADSWPEAVKRFHDAEAVVARLAAERGQAARALRDRPGLETSLQAADHSLAQLGHQESVVRQRIAETQRGQAAASAALDRAAAAHRDHRGDKPGFWVSLSTLFRAGREWEAEHRRLKGLRDQAEQVLGEWTAALARLTAESSDLVRRLREQTAERARVAAALGTATTVIADARNRWPRCLPEPPEPGGDQDAFQLCTPWADPEFTAARNQLTLEALRLHKAFVLGAGAPVRDNLRAAAELLSGNPAVTDGALLAIWQTLFLVVPVISTTFASLPRLFGRLGREALGWLFVDEAGQATPQQAAGGIWRTRRAVLVGDPQQLEPIVTLPTTAQHALLKQYRVTEDWLPDTTSAQRAADRLNRYGTSLPDPVEDGSTWVGAPLRVHRRCDRPVFDISNRIAYGGTLMVYGTASREPYPGRDRWIDVPSVQSGNNWIPAEGDALARLLEELRAGGVPPRDVRIVSPFRDVVAGAKRVARRTFGDGFAAANVGTVHTVQGQESDVVVLVLGSAPHNDRARGWAAATPNLLNVAVSRAKRRLYVIGDRKRWRNQRYFDVLAAALPADAESRR
ncbi:DEAD/DEAH box helicase [Amycolatopsis vastitatis]|uniref:DNA helicase n=1 Tax=Amycolatopsis vastitatis TaxID=1905142 RepID=A0A229TCQ8_9PSEU|nr:ATP-binding protein [Amycolatopsis vastitatis]OXM69036.1 DNA helicase [Amycolatopsis vastitatis]